MNLNIVLTSWQLKCSQLKLSLCLQVTLELKNNNIPHVHNLMKTSWMAQNNLHVEKRTLSGSSCEMGPSCGKDAILPFLYLKQKVFAAAIASVPSSYCSSAVISGLAHIFHFCRADYFWKVPTLSSCTVTLWDGECFIYLHCQKDLY